MPRFKKQMGFPLVHNTGQFKYTEGEKYKLITQGLEGYSWGLKFHQEMVQNSGFDCFQGVGFVKTGHGTQWDSDMKKSTGRIHPRIEPIFIEKENKHDS